MPPIRSRTTTMPSTARQPTRRRPGRVWAGARPRRSRERAGRRVTGGSWSRGGRSERGRAGRVRQVPRERAAPVPGRGGEDPSSAPWYSIGGPATGPVRSGPRRGRIGPRRRLMRPTGRLAAAVCAFLGGSAWGQVLDLDGLSRVRDATSARVSSAAPEDWSNRDNRWVKPGETFVMADLQGPGVIRHIWLTFSESRPNWLSKEGAADPSEIVLRMYWDGAEQPAVEAPLGDFFAAGFGRRAEIVSGPVIVQGGDSYNCFWPMPFARSAKITVTNESRKPVAALYYQIDYTREKSLPAETAYFCAQYRQEFPT